MIDPHINRPINPWYQLRKHVRIPKKAESKKFLDYYYIDPTPPDSAPVCIILPTILGPLVVGYTVACRPGDWEGDPAPVFTYDWRIEYTPTGVTTQTYVIKAADDGKIITCRVTATNSSGVGIQVTDDYGPITV